MSASWFFDENFNGVSDEFFDDVIKHMDFPLEDLEPNEDWNSKFQSIEPPLGLLSDLSSDFYKAPKNNHSTSHNRAPQLKQQSSIADTPSSGSTLLPGDSNDVKDSKRFQSSSPVSVLGSSISCSAENSTHVINPELVFPVKGTRSKRRRRPPTFNLYLIFSFPAYESESKSQPTEKRHREKQKLKKNLAVLSGTRETKKPYFEQAIATRKCTHCEVTNTPQWREGPLGPKTLCNACGVRYRSGRLLPEYRPAASPTFVPSVHSNSHKRILEIRNKVMQ